MEISRYLPPITLSRIKGVSFPRGKKEIKGELLSIVVTPQHMAEDPKFAAMRAVQMAMLAWKKGIAFVGLGALLPALTKYGTIIKRYVPNLGVTTGHAFTCWCIAQTTLKVIKQMGAKKENELIAILGAAGSTGRATTFVLAKLGIRKLLLVERPEKMSQLKEIKGELEEAFRDLEITLSSENADIQRSRIIITVTNAAGSIIREEWLKPGMIFIDDSQPANVGEEIAERHSDVLVIKVLADFPQLDPQFDFGLGTPPSTTFTCLVETALLAAAGWAGDHTIGYATISQAENVAHIATAVGATLPNLHYSFNGKLILAEQVKQVSQLWRG